MSDRSGSGFDSSGDGSSGAPGSTGTLTAERPVDRDDRPTDRPDAAHVRPSLQAQARSERVKLRRGLTFLGMTLVLPGSAQLAAGNRRVGRFALRVWAALWASLVLVALFALVWRSGAIAMFTAGPVLRIVQALLVVLGIGWGLLFLDAWRLARPPELARRHRLGFAVLNLGLVFAVTGGLIAASGVVSAQRDLMAAVFAGGGDKKANAGRYNILLMGGDAGKTRVGLRPDSLTVASVDAETGRTVLLSLPRNMEDVPFPESSPLHAKFPKGYTCADHSCMLNAVYTYATEHKDLYPGVKNPGAQATKEAVEGVTGLTINYWALIDLKGFESLVDAVGGITIDVNRRVPIGGGAGKKVTGYIEPGKAKHLNGHDALWFARSRSDSSDYDRMMRQKCVMSAMLNQLDPVTVLTNFNSIATAGKEIVATDIPASHVNDLVGLAMAAKSKPIASVAFVPPLVYPGQPDFAKIHRTVEKKIAASEAKDDPQPSATEAPTTAPTTGSSASSAPSASSSASGKNLKAGQQTEDVGAVCAAS